MWSWLPKEKSSVVLRRAPGEDKAGSQLLELVLGLVCHSLALLGGAPVLTWRWDGRCQHGLRCLLEPWKAAEPQEHPQCPCATGLALAQGWPARAHSHARKQVQGESLGDVEHPCPAPGTTHCGEGALSQRKDRTASSWARGRANSLLCLRRRLLWAWPLNPRMGLQENRNQEDLALWPRSSQNASATTSPPDSVCLVVDVCRWPAFLPCPLPPGSAPQPQLLGMALPLVS